MAGMTLTEAEAGLAAAQAALLRAQDKESYSIADRALKLANVKDLRETVDWWEGHIQRLTTGGSRLRAGVPLS